MKDWNDLYKKEGVIQKEKCERVLNAIKFFKDNDAKRVLDLGCGTGRYIEELKKAGLEAEGCDMSEKALQITQKAFPKIVLKRCDMTELEYEDNSFDAVLCNQVIQHGLLKEVKKAIAEIKRVLKKDGILYISVVSTKHPKFKTGKEIEKNTVIDTKALDGYIPHHFFTVEEMKELFRDFNILEINEYKTTPSALNELDLAVHINMYAKKLV